MFRLFPLVIILCVLITAAPAYASVTYNLFLIDRYANRIAIPMDETGSSTIESYNRNISSCVLDMETSEEYLQTNTSFQYSPNPALLMSDFFENQLVRMNLSITVPEGNDLSPVIFHELHYGPGRILKLNDPVMIPMGEFHILFSEGFVVPVWPSSKMYTDNLNAVFYGNREASDWHLTLWRFSEINKKHKFIDSVNDYIREFGHHKPQLLSIRRNHPQRQVDYKAGLDLFYQCSAAAGRY